MAKKVSEGPRIRKQITGIQSSYVYLPPINQADILSVIYHAWVGEGERETTGDRLQEARKYCIHMCFNCGYT